MSHCSGTSTLSAGIHVRLKTCQTRSQYFIFTNAWVKTSVILRAVTGRICDVMVTKCIPYNDCVRSDRVLNDSIVSFGTSNARDLEVRCNLACDIHPTASYWDNDQFSATSSSDKLFYIFIFAIWIGLIEIFGQYIISFPFVDLHPFASFYKVTATVPQFQYIYLNLCHSSRYSQAIW